jgi:hypothetical protein
MKISEIKSDEVRKEAVRLAIKAPFNDVSNESEALKATFFHAFNWMQSPQGFYFWLDLNNGKTPNTPDLKLPNL